MKRVLKIEVTDNLRANIAGAYGGEGARWLERLPDELDELAAHWKLSEVASFPEQSFNFVATAKDETGRPVFLKMGVPSEDIRLEIAALEAFKGRGAVRALRSDPARGWLLLERMDPGKTLLSLEGEEKRVKVVAELASQLWSAPLESAK